MYKQIKTKTHYSNTNSLCEVFNRHNNEHIGSMYNDAYSKISPIRFEPTWAGERLGLTKRHGMNVLKEIDEILDKKAKKISVDKEILIHLLLGILSEGTPIFCSDDIKNRRNEIREFLEEIK